MAISIWFALAVMALIATVATNRVAAGASESKATTRKTPSDQIIRSPRHYPIVDARAYS